MNIKKTNCLHVKLCANGRNLSQQLAVTRNNTQQLSTTHNNMQQGVQMDATCNIQQSCICLHGAVFGGKELWLFTILAMSDRQASLAVWGSFPCKFL